MAPSDAPRSAGEGEARPRIDIARLFGAKRAVLLDIDGTLVDSNDAHARAWVQAFAEHEVEVEFGAVRRCIGMGADKLMPAVSPVTEASTRGGTISARRAEIFAAEYLPRLQAFPGAAALVSRLQALGLRVVAASSAKEAELGPLLDIAGVREMLDGATSSDDAAESKPDPDIVRAALQVAGTRAADALMIGDTPYDVEAAARSGVEIVAVRCGGWTDGALRGAVAVFDGPWDILQHLPEGRAG